VELCDRLGEDIVKLAFQYTFAAPDVATCLVGTISADHLEENIKWLDLPLDQDLAREVQEVLAPIRNKLWVEQGSEENIALATSGFWADGR
jgi:aryl-alcohol dehydrogenase-like predicted oxidoreductase